MDPTLWVAQRFFKVRPEASSMLPNYGVFLIEGEPMGCLSSHLKFETNTGAAVAPVLVSSTLGRAQAGARYRDYGSGDSAL